MLAIYWSRKGISRSPKNIGRRPEKFWRLRREQTRERGTNDRAKPQRENQSATPKSKRNLSYFLNYRGTPKARIWSNSANPSPPFATLGKNFVRISLIILMVSTRNRLFFQNTKITTDGGKQDSHIYIAVCQNFISCFNFLEEQPTFLLNLSWK